MKTLKNICIILIGIYMVSCQKENIAITDSNDYENYLYQEDNKITKEAVRRLVFWNQRIQADSLQITALLPAAASYSQVFRSTGDIAYLKLAEKALQKSAEVAAIGKSEHLLALARNYISQHRFKEAKQAAQGAYLLGTNVKTTEMVLFDVSMELGEYDNAQKYLERFADQSDFNFLIRMAKWNDYKGNLDKTIRNMEKAQTIAENSKKETLMLWTYTNLADYYGHAGRIKESYEYYLKALAIDPSDAYSKKGIAWIIYSHEKNPEEALRILNVITKNYQSPDYFLLKAEIAEYQKNQIAKKINIKKYRNAVNNYQYGKMYNTYNALVLAEEYQAFDKALAIAEEEIMDRPTPQSYDLKAYILHLKGDHRQALEVAEKFVVNKTFEPEANYHIAQIYKANNLSEKARPIIEELIESSFELGPVTSQEIANL